MGFEAYEGSNIYQTVVNAWDADGLMACPPSSNTTEQQWQVFVNTKNASVPNGDISTCLDFDGLVTKTDFGGDPAAAWQYI